MRELLILLILLPVALLVVLSQALTDFQPSASQPTPVMIRVPIPTDVPVPTALSQRTDLFEQIVSVARSWLGVRYSWGGCSRSGTDCSCFVRNVLLAVGINAPRTTVEQVRWARPVSRDQLAVGDLVFFDNTCELCGANPTHVGMYIGGGQMIEAGDPVQVAPVFGGFYGSHFAEAGRPPGL